MEATRARAMVWQLMQQAVQENTSPAMTLADLSAAVTRSAARILDMDEDDLVQLLRSHRPH